MDVKNAVTVLKDKCKEAKVSCYMGKFKECLIQAGIESFLDENDNVNILDLSNYVREHKSEDVVGNIASVNIDEL